MKIWILSLIFVVEKCQNLLIPATSSSGLILHSWYFLITINSPMAIEATIKQGDLLAEALNFLGAIAKYSEALTENPEAFAPVIKRAQVFTKLKDYSKAREDIEQALNLAEKRGKMHEKALCYFRMGLVQYGEKKFAESSSSFHQAQKLRCSEPSLDIWIQKADRDLKKISQNSLGSASNFYTSYEMKSHPVVANGSTTSPVTDPEPSTQQNIEAKASSLTPVSTSLDAINKHAPLKVKIRDDWYQDNESVTVTIYAKQVDKNVLQVDFNARSVSISFPSADNSEYSYNLDPLFGAIDPALSTCRVFSTKVELTLKKVSAGKWPSLEGSAETFSQLTILYPSSSKKAIDWSSFEVSDEVEESEDFFAKLYKDVDEDTRRAMMKSYVESNGTVLTTNWSEAKLKTFEVSPPEGMEVKKW